MLVSFHLCGGCCCCSGVWACSYIRVFLFSNMISMCLAVILTTSLSKISFSRASPFRLVVSTLPLSSAYICCRSECLYTGSRWQMLVHYVSEILVFRHITKFLATTVQLVLTSCLLGVVYVYYLWFLRIYSHVPFVTPGGHDVKLTLSVYTVARHEDYVISIH